MKYSININQLALSRIAPNITLTDAAILDYLLNFYSLSQTSPGNYKTILLDNRQFLWIDFQNLLDEMPLLKIKSKGGLSKALSRLTGPRLIEKYLYKNELYIRPGSIVQEMFFDGRKPKCE